MSTVRACVILISCDIATAKKWPLCSASASSSQFSFRLCCPTPNWRHIKQMATHFSVSFSDIKLQSDCLPLLLLPLLLLFLVLPFLSVCLCVCLPERQTLSRLSSFLTHSLPFCLPRKTDTRPTGSATGSCRLPSSPLIVFRLLRTGIFEAESGHLPASRCLPVATPKGRLSRALPPSASAP